MKYHIYIKGMDCSKYAVLPIVSQDTRDESLATATLTLIGTPATNTLLNKEIPPFTQVAITTEYIDKNNLKQYNVEQYVVQSDSCSEAILIGKYNHELRLIERTKWLERFTNVTKTLTQYNTNINVNSAYVHYKNLNYIETENYVGEMYRTNLINTNIVIGNIVTLPSTVEFAGNGGTSYSAKIYKDNTLIYETTDGNEIYEFEVEDVSEYKIEYTKDNNEHTVYIRVVGSERPSYKTVTDIINDVLLTAEPLRDGMAQRFTLYDYNAEKYSNIKAPDFSLAGNLFECLSSIGSYVNAIPQIWNDTEIHFIDLDDFKYFNDDIGGYCSKVGTFDIEQYASGLVSQASNIINVNSTSGSMHSAGEYIWKTPRTEVLNAQLTEGNLIIETEYPIYKIISVECGYTDNIWGGRHYIGYITSYIRELADYQILSSYYLTDPDEFGIPKSKSFALYYQQGQKNISGLNFQAPIADTDSVAPYSIQYIMAHKLDVDVSKFISENIMNLQFKVRYIPMTNVNISQTKSDIRDFRTYSKLNFNQSSEVINSQAYGSMLKSKIERLGNPSEDRLYYIKDLDKLPNVGDIIDGKYISIIKTEKYTDIWKVQLALTEKNVKISEYIPLNSQKRQYVIDEKNVTNRSILYEDFCIISKEDYIEEPQSDNYSMAMTADFIDKIVGRFDLEQTSSQTNTMRQLDMAKIQMFADFKIPLEIYYKPIYSYGFGNSLNLGFEADDNYGIGTQIQRVHNALIQQQLRYCDKYGECEYMKLSMGSAYNEVDNYTDAVSQGREFPQNKNLDNPIEFTPTFTTMSPIGEQMIHIRKDNREKIIFNYQMNFVHNIDGFIIGNKYTDDSYFTSDTLVKLEGLSMFVFSYNLQDNNKPLELWQGTLVATFGNSEDEHYVPITKQENENKSQFNITFGDGIVAPKDCKSWAITLNGEIYLAQNGDFKQGEKILDKLYFTTQHRIN